MGRDSGSPGLPCPGRATPAKWLILIRMETKRGEMGAAGRPGRGRYLLRHREEGSAGRGVINGQTEALLLLPRCDPRLAGSLGRLQKRQEGEISREINVCHLHGQDAPSPAPSAEDGKGFSHLKPLRPSFPREDRMCRTQPSLPREPSCTLLAQSPLQQQEENATTSLLMDKVHEPRLPWHFGFWCLGSRHAHTALQGRRFGVLRVFSAPDRAWEAPA